MNLAMVIATNPDNVQRSVVVFVMSLHIVQCSANTARLFLQFSVSNRIADGASSRLFCFSL